MNPGVLANLLAGTASINEPDLEGRIISVADLISRAVFRRRTAPAAACPHTFMRIRPIGELVDMYRFRQATLLHDKLFALFGMADPQELAQAKLVLDYGMSWELLLQRLGRHLLGSQVSMQVWNSPGSAIAASGEGFVCGKVTAIENGNRDNRQRLLVTSGQEKMERALPRLAVSVQVGDIICRLQGASAPTIIRPCQDYFSIVMAAAPIDMPEGSLLREFLLIWDLTSVQENPRHWRFATYRSLLEGRGMEDHTARLWRVAEILQDAESYSDAEWRLEDVVKALDAAVGKQDARSLNAKAQLALSYRKQGKWKQAQDLLREVIQTRKEQNPDDPELAQSWDDWVFAYQGRKRLWYCTLQIADMLDFLEQRNRLNRVKIWETRAVSIAGQFDHQVMDLLLDHLGGDAEITEDVMVAAASNGQFGHDMVGLLLRHRQQTGDKLFAITENVAAAAAANDWQGDVIMKILLDSYARAVDITDKVIAAAAGNLWRGDAIMQLLLDQRGKDIRISGPVTVEASKNWRCGNKVMELLRAGGEKEKMGTSIHQSLVSKLDRSSANKADARIFILPPPHDCLEQIYDFATVQYVYIWLFQDCESTADPRI